MEENKEKSIKLAIEAMRPLPVNSFAGYCSVGDDRSPEEKHKDDMRFCKEFNELQSDMLITLASKIEAFLDAQRKDSVESVNINHPTVFPDGRNCCVPPYIDRMSQQASKPFDDIDKNLKDMGNDAKRKDSYAISCQRKIFLSSEKQHKQLNIFVRHKNFYSNNYNLTSNNMCVLIYDGDVEIQSPKQLEDHFPQITKMIPAEGYDNIIPESCLCQVDIENTLDSAGIKYIEDCGDYIIIK